MNPEEDKNMLDPYELEFKGFLPGDLAMDFRTAHQRVSRAFIAPTSVITVLCARKLFFGDQKHPRFVFLTVTMPRWKSRLERLDPDRDSVPHQTADPFIKSWTDHGGVTLTLETINLSAEQWRRTT
jgi:hypothetical protein